MRIPSSDILIQLLAKQPRTEIRHQPRRAARRRLAPAVHLAETDRSFHGVDMVHPSVKGSRAIAARVADLIKGSDG